MKKLNYFLFIFSLAFFSCKKEEPIKEDVKPIDIEQKLIEDFSVVTKFNQSEAHGFSLSNITIGKEVPYTLTIEDANFKEKDVYYIIYAEKTSDSEHKAFAKDYTLLINSDGKKEEVSEEANYTFLKDGNSTLYITPKNSGTFRVNFTIQKYKSGEKSSIASQKFTLLFNVVGISARSEAIKTRDYSNGVFGIGGYHSEHRRDYFFKIDDGDLPTDLYLKPNEKTKIIYYISYNGKSFSGDFKPGVEIKFYETKVREKGPPNVENPIIDEIKLLIEINGQKDNEIVYRKINLS